MPSADFLGAAQSSGTGKARLAGGAALFALLVVGVALVALAPGDLRARFERVVGLPRGGGSVEAARPGGAGSSRLGTSGETAGIEDTPEDSGPVDVPKADCPRTVQAAGTADESRAHVDSEAPAGKPSPPLRPRPLSDSLAEIAVLAGRGLVVAPEVSGETFALFERNTGWRERLAALARVHGFRFTVGDRLIEAWAKPRDESEPRGSASAASGAEPSTITAVNRPVHARAGDLVTAVAKAARATDVQVAADPGSNAVVIAGADADVAVISDLVRELDVPRRRFVLEAEIVELSRKARQELGVRWSIDGTVGAIVDFPAADTPGEGAAIVVATDGAHVLRARISALAADGHVRVVSRPRVVVLEGRPASIESVRILRVRFPDRTAIVGEAEDAQAVAGGRAVEEIPVGVTLRVEPSMQGDGKIVLRIRAKSSTLGPPQPPDGIPEELSRMVDAEVAVADGETAVLGGLMRQGSNRSGTGVPVLRSVPVVGLLFGKREHEDDDEELVVLVTPKLLPP